MKNEKLVEELIEEYNFPESFKPYLDSLTWQISYKPKLCNIPQRIVLKQICNIVSKYDLKKEALRLFDDAVLDSKNLSLGDFGPLCAEEDNITSRKIKRTISGLKTRIDEYLRKDFSGSSGNCGRSEKFSPVYSDLQYQGSWEAI